jgi:hypothetical protein
MQKRIGVGIFQCQRRSARLEVLEDVGTNDDTFPKKSFKIRLTVRLSHIHIRARSEFGIESPEV